MIRGEDTNGTPIPSEPSDVDDDKTDSSDADGGTPAADTDEDLQSHDLDVDEVPAH